MSTVNKIELGDEVRSFDFPDISRAVNGINANYIEGVVVDIETKMFPFDCYKIKTHKAIHSGNDSAHFAEFYYPPVNGTEQVFSNKLTNFVEKI